MRDLVEVIARVLGWKPPAAGSHAGSSANDAALAELMAQFPDGRVKG